MLRYGMFFLLAMTTIGTASGADQTVLRPGKHLRAHYKFRTVITDATPRPFYVYRDPDVLFTPMVPYIPPLIRAPLLPGSLTLPAYYGLPNSYDYPGPYYVGPEIGYWHRLPYACGVYGYC
jgi:hypothetical protein